MKENDTIVNDECTRRRCWRYVDAARGVRTDVIPAASARRSYVSHARLLQPAGHDSSAFLDGEARSASSIASACFGVAGPVAGDVADLTNIPWHVDANHVARAFGLSRVNLLNDLEALAYALPVLIHSEVRVLQTGHPVSKESIAVIAAGTGLGEAVLHSVDGRYRVHAMEAGHADFAARSDRDVTDHRDLSRDAAVRPLKRWSPDRA